MKDKAYERQAASIVSNLITALDAAAKRPESANLAIEKMNGMTVSPDVKQRIANLLKFVAQHGIYAGSDGPIDEKHDKD